MIWSKQRGLSLLEITFTLVILSAVSVSALNFAEQSTMTSRANAAGQEMATFSSAVKAYTRDNFAAVAAVATATTPALINTATLTAVTATNPTGTRYLPLGAAAQNSYGQRYCALVLEPSAEELNTLVFTESGSPINDIDLAQMAGVISALGISGGGIYASSPTQARGSLGAWSVPVSDFAVANNLGTRCDGTTAGVVSLEAGHPAVALWFDSNFSMPGVLYRNAVPGQPTLNQMNTTLNVGGNGISNGGELAAGVFGGTTLNVTGAASVLNMQPMSTFVVGGACTSIGLVSKNAAGEILSCLSTGKWAVAPGGQPAYKRLIFNTEGVGNGVTSKSWAWTVPPNVKSIFVTMAGGGGTAQGFQVTSNVLTGHSGGFVSRYPLAVTPGEILTLTVGTGGELKVDRTNPNTSYYGAVCDNPDPNAVATMQLSPGLEGTGSVVGFRGYATTITSNLRPDILQCGGGAGGSPGGIGNITGYILANTTNVPGGLLFYGYDDVPVTTPGATPVVASVGGGIASVAGSNRAGSCASAESGSWVTLTAGENGINAPGARGVYPGGRTLIGYGSGGGVRIANPLKTWALPVTNGMCIQSLPAESGVIMIDYPS